MENLLIDNMLENAKIGIWVIELSHNKRMTLKCLVILI